MQYHRAIKKAIVHGKSVKIGYSDAAYDMQQKLVC